MSIAFLALLKAAALARSDRSFLVMRLAIVFFILSGEKDGKMACLPKFSPVLPYP
jgi:hypothetical protein